MKKLIIITAHNADLTIYNLTLKNKLFCKFRTINISCYGILSQWSNTYTF